MDKSAPEKQDENRPHKRTIACVVVSDKMNKSRVGVAERVVKHRIGKYLRRRTRLMFHDEKNETKIGDQVLIVSTRPLSKSKRFTLEKIVTRPKE